MNRSYITSRFVGDDRWANLTTFTHSSAIILMIPPTLPPSTIHTCVYHQAQYTHVSTTKHNTHMCLPVGYHQIISPNQNCHIPWSKRSKYDTKYQSVEMLIRDSWSVSTKGTIISTNLISSLISFASDQ